MIGRVSLAVLGLAVIASSNFSTISAQDGFVGQYQVSSPSVLDANEVGTVATASSGTNDVGSTDVVVVGASGSNVSDADTNSTNTGESTATTIMLLGGWTSVAYTNTEINLLLDTLSLKSNYASTINDPICISSIHSLDVQSVSGTKYKFEVSGCPISFNDTLGACNERVCTAANYDVVVYVPLTSDSCEIQSITTL